MTGYLENLTISFRSANLKPISKWTEEEVYNNIFKTGLCKDLKLSNPGISGKELLGMNKEDLAKIVNSDIAAKLIWLIKGLNSTSRGMKKK